MIDQKFIRVAIYIRVSTQEQAIEGYSIEIQRDKLLSYCKARGWNVAEIFVDPGHSGASLERPDMQRLISHINDFDVVLVMKLDRLSRSQKDTLYLIEDLFLPNNVDFVSVNESFDTSTAFGRAMVGILSVFAQLERETIRERTSGGRAKRAEKGLYGGGGNTPIGYDYSDGKLHVNNEQSELIRKTFELYNAGYGQQTIANVLGYKNSTIVRQILVNPLYIGKLRYSGNVYDGQHAAIITDDVFNETQRQMNERNRVGSFDRKYLLSGLVSCAYCGAKMSIRTGSSGIGKDRIARHYYTCYSKSKFRPHLVKDPNCPSKNWKRDELESMVDYHVRSLVFDTAEFDRLLSTENIDKNKIARDSINKQIRSIDGKIEKLLDLYQAEHIPVEMINTKIKSLTDEKNELVAQLNALPVVKPPDIEKSRALVSETAKLWDKSNDEQKRRLLTALTTDILVYSDRIEMIWSFL